MVQVATNLALDLDPQESQSFGSSAQGDEPYQCPNSAEKVTSSQASTKSLLADRIEIHDEPLEHNSSDVHSQAVVDLTLDESYGGQASTQGRATFPIAKRTYEEYSANSCRASSVNHPHDDGTTGEPEYDDSSHLCGSQESGISARNLEARRVAFNAVLNQSDWSGLLSTTNNHTHPEFELGESS